MKRASVVTFFALLLSALTFAQVNNPVPLVSNATTFLEAKAFAVGNRPLAIAVGDFNGDGKPDIVTADNTDAAVAVLLGVGNGTFKPSRNYLVDNPPLAIVVGDFNGDGKLDLAVGTSDIFILLGNGDGTFRVGGSYASGSAPNYMAVGDFTGSGKLDIAFSSDNSFSSGVIQGNGDGTFQAPVKLSTTAVGPIGVGDFNGDGKLDIVIANDGANENGGTLEVLSGNGNLTFGAAIQSGATKISPASLAVGDFNNDGHLDVVLGNPENGLAAQPVLVAFGDGTGKLKDYKYVNAGSEPISVVAADMNGDGNLDIVVGNAADSDVTVLLGNGKGIFSPGINYAAGNGQVLPVAVADFNGDGKPDIASANETANNVSVFLNSGGGRFSGARDFRSITVPFWMVTADFNKDGKQDIALASDFSYLDVQFGNGNGTFGAPVPVISSGLNGGFLAAGDLNGDGYPDLVMLSSSNGSEAQILLNNGDGTFQSPVGVFVGTSPQEVVIGDFNGDGKLDLAVTIRSFVSILLGNGDGTFQSPMPFSAGALSIGLAVGDFNGDGKLDIVTGDFNSGNIYLLLGNGNGTFKPAKITNVSPYASVTVAVGDFNGDGKLDLAADQPEAATVSILLGNGNGTFKTPVSYTAGQNLNAVYPMTVADYNRDGALDIALPSSANNAVVLFGKGDGTFTTTTFGYGNGFFLVSGDFNGDNKPDLAISDGIDSFTVLLNQTK